MAPKYILTYFNAQGRVEPVRFLFKYGNIDFEDVRVQREEWPKLKEKFPFGQLPILEHNGKVVNQSAAICRYLAKIVKLDGKDEWENLEIDAIVDTIVDFRTKLMTAVKEQDETKKKALMETNVKETIPFYFSRLEAIAQKNNGYLATGKLTWADLYFVGFCPGFEKFLGSNIFDKYPNLKALKNKVEALPAIKRWLQERPATEF